MKYNLLELMHEMKIFLYCNYFTTVLKTFRMSTSSDKQCCFVFRTAMAIDGESRLNMMFIVTRKLQYIHHSLQGTTSIYANEL